MPECQLGSSQHRLQSCREFILAHIEDDDVSIYRPPHSYPPSLFFYRELTWVWVQSTCRRPDDPPLTIFLLPLTSEHGAAPSSRAVASRQSLGGRREKPTAAKPLDRRAPADVQMDGRRGRFVVVSRPIDRHGAYATAQCRPRPAGGRYVRADADAEKSTRRARSRTW
jgi:hypothetical protein